jgi:hypothetical protein
MQFDRVDKEGATEMHAGVQMETEAHTTGNRGQRNY